MPLKNMMRDGKFDFSLNAPGFDRDPFPVYSYMRAHEPVHWWGEGKAWIVTRYADVVQTLRDPRFSVEFRWYGPGDLRDEELTPHNLLTKYGIFWMPDSEHNRLRSVMAPHFSAKAVGRTKRRLEDLARRILSEAETLERYDIVQDFTLRYEAEAIALVLGIPGDRHKDFIRFASAILDAFYPTLDPDEFAERTSFLPTGVQMVRELIREARTNPREGLLSDLANAHGGGRPLTENELLSAVSLVISAGSEPTRHIIAFAIWNLLRHPDQLAVLRTEPGLLRNAIGEVGRFDGIGKLNFPRFPTEDLEIRGVRIGAGQPVYGVFTSAMRDPEVFVRADVFDIKRDLSRSLMWSVGLHNCMGRWIAQMAIEVAVSALLDRFSTFRCDGDPVYAPDTFFRKMVSLPVVLQSGS
ncbi:cytochrome P450 [Streptomyces roseifaciens]